MVVVKVELEVEFRVEGEQGKRRSFGGKGDRAEDRGVPAGPGEELEECAGGESTVAGWEG